MAGIREIFEIVDRATAPVRAITQAFTGSAQAAERAGKTTQTSVDQMGQSADKTVQKVDKNRDALEQMGKTGKRAGKDAADGIDRTAASADRAGVSIGKIVALLGGMATIKSAIGLADEMTLTAARLNNVNDGMQTTAELQQMIYQSAQRARGDYMQMSQTVAALKAQTGDTFASVKEAVGFAELLNKQFKIAGTDATGVASTMYNLTQALSSGALKGNDLNSVLTNAPQLVQRIADYMGVPVGKIKDIAAEGKITADVVKGAILGSAEDINAQFEAMPMTFADATQKIKNVGVQAFQPIGQMIANAVNSPQFDAGVRAISRGLMTAAAIGTAGFRLLGAAVQFASDHMAVIGPILGVVTAAVIAYNAATLISNGITAATAAVQGVAATAKAIYTAATAAATAGQTAFNAALAACPLTWIITAIVAVIAAVIALIVIFHNLAATGHTVAGDIAGVIFGVGAVFLNTAAMIANAGLAAAEFLANAFLEFSYQADLAVYNFAVGAATKFNGVVDAADSAATAIANAFISGANMAIGGINALIGALNNIPGVNIGTVGTIGQVGSVLGGAKIDVSGIAAPVKAGKVSLGRFETTSTAEAFQSGFDKGATIGDSAQNNLTSMFSGLTGQVGDLMGGGSIADLISSQGDLADAMGGAGGAGGSGGGSGGKSNVGSVDKVKKIEDCKLSDEDLKLYKDLAEQRYINRIELQTLAPQISVSVPESAAKNLTSQDIADKLAAMLIEQSAAHTSQSHADVVPV